MPADIESVASAIDIVREYWDRRPCNIRHSPKTLGSREYFAEVEARKYFVEPHIPAFAEFPRWQGKRILEIGCGIGTDTINFARHGALVTAVELSETSLALARRRAEVFGVQDRIEFHLGNAEELTTFIPVHPYDLIYAFGVLHHTPNPGRALRELCAYAKPGTTVKLMVYHRRSWKVCAIVLRHGYGRFWRTAELVARHSEASEGCPVTWSYTPREIRSLLESCSLRVDSVRIEHIFPFRVADYRDHRYVREWYFRLMPARLFRWLEHVIGWHLCVTATA